MCGLFTAAGPGCNEVPPTAITHDNSYLFVFLGKVVNDSHLVFPTLGSAGLKFPLKAELLTAFSLVPVLVAGGLCDDKRGTPYRDKPR